VSTKAELWEALGIASSALEQIAGDAPTSHRRALDQLRDSVKWRQGIARDALVKIERTLDERGGVSPSGKGRGE
jgi:hypothetical protein